MACGQDGDQSLCFAFFGHRSAIADEPLCCVHADEQEAWEQAGLHITDMFWNRVCLGHCRVLLHTRIERLERFPLIDFL